MKKHHIHPDVQMTQNETVSDSTL